MNRRLNLIQSSGNATEETRARGTGATGNRFDIDIPSLALVLFRRRRLIVGVMAAVTLLACAAMLLSPNRYTSRAIILPSGKSPSGLSALKAMVGFGGGMGMSDENSSALFPLILGSHAVRDAVLNASYTYTADGGDTTLTLPEYFGQTDPDKLRLKLAGITSVRADSRTGEIVVAVETEYPEFSQAIVQEYLEQLEAFNLHQRKSSATENVRYLLKQVDDARGQLETAELALQKFRQENANWAEMTSPELITKHQRLLRENEIRSTAYLLLQEQYELAKLEAQKDIPIINLLDRPSLPTVKSGPHRTITVLSAQAVSFVVLMVVIFGMDIGRQIWRGSDPQAVGVLKEDFQRSFPKVSRLLRIRETEYSQVATRERSPVEAN